MNNNKEKLSRLHKTRKIFSNIFFTLIVIIGLIIAFSLIPIKGNYKLLSVMPGSMEPIIPVGSLIIVKPVSEYNVGDVVTFQFPGNGDKTTHRIYSQTYENDQIMFTTKGDANKIPDTIQISSDSIVGKHFATLSWMGYVLNYIKTPVGLVLIIVIPAAIIVYEEIKKIISETKNIVKNRRQKRKKAKDDKNS